MSDDTNSQGTPQSWTPPPPGNSPPPPPLQDYQAPQTGPGPDATGGTPQPAAKSGPNVNLSPEIVLGLLLKVENKVGAVGGDAEN